MIARSWKCRTKPGRTAAFLDHLSRTGLAEAGATPGYEGQLLTCRASAHNDSEAELRLVTLWTDIEAVRRFAGSNSREAAVSYPEDDAFLVSADQTVEHTMPSNSRSNRSRDDAVAKHPCGSGGIVPAMALRS